MIRFATPRLTVRDTEETDFPALLALYTSREVMRYISSGRYDWTLEELKTKYNRLNADYPNGFGLFAVRLDDTGTVIGEAGLFNSYGTPSVLELGYILAREAWGKGYGTEVCNGLIRYGFGLPGVVKLTARMYAVNEASVRLCEKMRMKRVATGETETGQRFYTYELTRDEIERNWPA